MKTYGYFMEKGSPGEAGVGEKEYGLQGGRANTGCAFLQGVKPSVPWLVCGETTQTPAAGGERRV